MQIEKKEILFRENQRENITDSIGKNPRRPRPKGRVQIFERQIKGTDKKLYLVRDTSNLVVYHGRNWLMQRAFAQDMSQSGFTDWNTYKIGWFAIGTGGAPVDPMTPTAPTLADRTLTTPGLIGSGSNYVTFGGNDYHSFDSGTVTFEADPDITTGYTGYDNYLVAKVTVTLASNEANNDGGTSGVSGVTYYQDINEAGLFFSDSNEVSTAPTAVEMFARVTFETMRKTSSRELIFKWYIFF